MHFYKWIDTFPFVNVLNLIFFRQFEINFNDQFLGKNMRTSFLPKGLNQSDQFFIHIGYLNNSKWDYKSLYFYIYKLFESKSDFSVEQLNSINIVSMN